MGEAPEYVSGPDLNDEVRKGLSISARAQDLHGRLREEGREVTLNPSRVMQEATRSHDFRQSSAAGKFVRRQPGRTRRGPSLSARPRPVRRRCHAAGPAACGHPAQPGRARPDPRDRYRCARAMPGVHAVITAADMTAAVPTIPLRQEPLPAFKPYEQPVIAHGKVRYVGEPIAVVVADSAGHRRGRTRGDRGRHRSPAGGRRSRRIAQRRRAAVRGRRQQSHQPRSRPSKATPRRPSRTRPIRGASASRCSASPPCRWSRAACWRSGMPAAGG